MHPFEHSSDQKQANRLGYLFAKYLRGDLSVEEFKELNHWREASNDNESMFQRITDSANVQTWLDEYLKIDADSSLQEVKKRLQERKRKRRIKLISYAAAACTIALIATMNFWQSKPDLKELVISDPEPGQPRAILIRGNGQRIALNQLPIDTVLDGRIRLLGDSNGIRYDSVINKIEWHRLEIPSNAYYQLRLSDGTTVWLNNSSVLKYPSMFSGSERNVELSGEAYFEVAHDPIHPFKVNVGEQIVEAIGTSFVVQAYSNENVWTTTLVEGGVQINAGGQQTTLLPGHAADWTAKRLSQARPASIVAATSWVRQEFYWRQTDVAVVCNQLSRWYGVPVKWTGTHPIKMNAVVNRNIPLSRVISVLEKTGELKIVHLSNEIHISN